MTLKPLILLISIAVLTAGCGTDRLFLREDCDWAQPIRPARTDVLSENTKAQILAHNEIGARLCGWRP
jgi:hypothetical protein